MLGTLDVLKQVNVVSLPLFRRYHGTVRTWQLGTSRSTPRAQWFLLVGFSEIDARLTPHLHVPVSFSMSNALHRTCPWPATAPVTVNNPYTAVCRALKLVNWVLFSRWVVKYVTLVALYTINEFEVALHNRRL